MKRKHKILIAAAFPLLYMGSYCGLRLFNVLVRQEISLINRTDAMKDGRAICYFVHQDIGRGSPTDPDNYGRIRQPTAAVRLAKRFYLPLVELELSYWRSTRPGEILETICDQ
ncbi:MAG: hypothetical protein ACYS8Z_11300 [Planctomycetota bacterium]|jgi:hypothetical protein